MRWIQVVLLVALAMSGDLLFAQTPEEVVFHRSGSVNGEPTIKMLRTSKIDQQDADKEITVGKVKGTTPKGTYQTESYRLVVDGKARWSKQVVDFLDVEYVNGHLRFGLYDVTQVGQSLAILYVHRNRIQLDIVESGKDGKVAERTIELPLTWSNSIQIRRGRLISGDGGLFAMVEVQRGSAVDVELWEFKGEKASRVWNRPAPFAAEDDDKKEGNEKEDVKRKSSNGK